MIKNKKEDIGKKCFIITPIGDTNSDIFRKAKGVIESVIKPVLQNYGFDDIKPAYEIMESGMIGNQIVDRIINDDLVVANLTGNNPNVMYELAIRHATAKPVIHICEKGTTLPFDIKDNRTSFYRDDMLGTQELREEFENYVAGVDFSREYMDNPIYSGMEMASILKKIGNDGRQAEAELLQKILDKVSNDTKESQRKIYATPSATELFKEADFMLKRNPEHGRESADFLKEFEKRIKSYDIMYMGSNANYRYYKNLGELALDEIKQIVDEVSSKHNAGVIFLSGNC